MKVLLRKMPLLLLAVNLFFSSFAGHAQQSTKGSFTGKVLSADNVPVANITVLLKGTGRGTVTDEAGIYKFENVQTGIYTVEFSFAGLEPKAVEVNVKAGETVLIADIILAENIKRLGEVVVVGAAKKFAKKQSNYVARMPISNLENPQVYTVVPKELVQEQMAIDFRSAITAAPGLTNVVQSVGSGGVGLSLRTRGFSGNAGSIRNGANTNWVTTNDPANLETIEVIKGPSATLFGTSLITYGGLVNRVTKKPLEYLKGEVSYSTGSWALSRTTLDFNMPFTEDKSVLFRLNAAVDNQKTWQDYGRSSTTFISPAFTFKVNEKLSFDFEAELYKGKRNATYIGTGGAGPAVAKSLDDLNFDFKRSYTTDDFLSDNQNTNIFAKATYLLSDKWTSQTILSNAFTDNKANYLFLLVATDTSITRRLMNINSVFKTTQLQQNFTGDFKIGNMRNRLLLGAEYNYLSTNDNRWIVNSFDVVKINKPAAFINVEKFKSLIAAMAGPTIANNRERRTFSIYASDVINITNRLIAMASVRFDNFNDVTTDYKQSNLSPKMGLVYQVVKNKVSVFANYMNGFTNVAPATTAANPTELTTFKPEQANQVEGGVKFELLEGKLNGTISYYDIKVKNKVRTDPANTLYSLQDGTQESKGFEADLIANPVKGLHLILGYGHNESRFTKAAANVQGKTPASSPVNVGNFWVSYKLTQGAAKGFGIGFGGNTQSNSYINDTNTFMAEGFTTFDGTVFLDKSKFRLGLKLNNITNQKYFTSDFWANMMPTRQLVANATFRF